MNEEVEPRNNQNNEGDDQCLVISDEGKGQAARSTNLIDERIERPQVENKSESESIDVWVDGSHTVPDELLERVYQNQQHKDGDQAQVA